MAKTKTRPTDTIEIRETTSQSHLKPDAIDREAGVIRGVKLLGRVSKNGREYTDKALDSAVRLMEGATAGIYHKRNGDDREFTETNGVFRNVHLRSDGVYGDHLFEKENPHTPLMLERAERFPSTFGYSQHALGRSAKRGGKTIVEDLERVVSVDFVRGPATTSGMWESEGFDERVKLAEFPHESPLLVALLEIDGMADMQVTAGMDSADPVKEAFKAAISAVLDLDCDVKECAAKVAEILKAYEKVSAGLPTNDQTQPGAETPPQDPPVEGAESEGEMNNADAPPGDAPSLGEDEPGAKKGKKMQEKQVSIPEKEWTELKEAKAELETVKAELAGLKKRETAREVLASVKREGDKELFEALCMVEGKEAMEAVAKLREGAELQESTTGPRPAVRSLRSMGGEGSVAKYPEDRKGFVASLRRG